MRVTCGRFTLSIMAGEGYYSTPAENGLTSYNSYEVAIWQTAGGPFMSPSELGIPGFPSWHPGDVGGWVIPQEIDQLREALAKL